jgi:phosphoenolpyruvate carboxykinase (ATP)
MGGNLQAQQAKSQMPVFAHQRSGFIRAMSDAGLKPTVVHHNLTPAELYEQVSLAACMRSPCPCTTL